MKRLSRAALLFLAALGASSRPAGAQDAQTDTAESLRSRVSAQAAGLSALIDFSVPFSLPGGSGGGDDPLADLVAGNAAVALRTAEQSAAKADAAGARARRLPSVDASFNAAWIGNPADPLSLPAGSLSPNPLMVLPPEDVVLYEGSGATLYEAKVAVAQPLFAWRKIENGIAAADAAHRLALARTAGERHLARVQAGADAETLAVLRLLDDTLALQAEAGRHLVRISEESRRGGFITDAELLDARLKLKETDLARAETAERRGSLLRELRRLSALDDLREEDLDGTAPAAGRPPLAAVDRADAVPGDADRAAADLADAAVKGNWDLAALAELKRVKAAQQRVAAAARPRRPDLGFMADLSWTGSFEDLGEEAWQDKGEWQLTVGVGLSGRIFDGGASAAAYARATADGEGAAIQAADAERRLRSTVEQSLLRLELLRTRLEHTALTLQVRDRVEADARSALAAGAGGERELLAAIIDRAAAVAEGYSRLAEYRGEIWKLAGALGGALD